MNKYEIRFLKLFGDSVSSGGLVFQGKYNDKFIISADGIDYCRNSVHLFKYVDPLDEANKEREIIAIYPSKYTLITKLENEN